MLEAVVLVGICLTAKMYFLALAGLVAVELEGITPQQKPQA